MCKIFLGGTNLEKLKLKLSNSVNTSYQSWAPASNITFWNHQLLDREYPDSNLNLTHSERCTGTK